MLTRLLKYIFVGYAMIKAFQHRYRIMNWFLANERFRRWAVATSMQIPNIRNLFIQSAFHTTEDQ